MQSAERLKLSTKKSIPSKTILQKKVKLRHSQINKNGVENLFLAELLSTRNREAIPQAEMKGLDSNTNPHEKIKNISKGNYVSK